MVKHCYQGKHLNNHPTGPQSLGATTALLRLQLTFLKHAISCFQNPLLLAFALPDELFIHLFTLTLPLFTLDFIPSIFCRLYILKISNKEKRWALNSPIYWQTFVLNKAEWVCLYAMPDWGVEWREEGLTSWLCYLTLSKAMWQKLFLWLGYTAPSPMQILHSSITFPSERVVTYISTVPRQQFSHNL